MADDLDLQVTAEIEDLHAAFEQWFAGRRGASLQRVERALADEFTLIAPSGALVERQTVLDDLRSAKGSRDIRIRIESPKVQWHDSSTVLATYEEWHDHGAVTTARRTTVVFARDAAAPHGLVWRHVYETWIKPPG